MTTRGTYLVFLLVCFMIVAVTGCGLPQWRVGQKKIDATLAEKSPSQTEAERQGARFIEIKSANLEADPASQVAAIHAVAVPLSASLGEPTKAVTIEDKDAIIADLQKGLLAQQAKAEKWKAFAKKYAGQEIEGTGIDLAPWGGGIGILALVAACILVPGFGTLVLFVIRRLRGTIQQMAQGVEEFAIEKPEEAAALKNYVRGAMDKANKAIVRREKQYLDQVKLQELMAAKVAAAATPEAAT